MISVNDDIKQAYSLSTTQIDRIILNDTPYYITNVEYSDNCYQDGNVFGTAEARQLAFEIENSVNLERQEYEYQTGIVVNGVVEWISLGNFITFDTEEDDTNGITKVNAMDNMIKSNVLYDHTSLDYSVGVTIKEILEDALEQCGLELGTSSFVNSDFVCYSDQFEDNALIRQVIIACAQISGTFAKIRSDNKLYLINPNKALYGDLVTEEDIYLKTEKGNKLILLERRIDRESGVAESNTFFDLRDYENTTLKRNTHEINTLVLGLSNVEGENVTVRDEDMIAEDGNENKIVINDNPFAYTQALRTQLINPIFNSIKGFAYTAYELKCQGLPYLECGDSVSVKTMEGNSIESYVFRYTFKSPNGLDSTIEAPSLTDAEVLYENVENLDTRLRRTEIVVDKENQQIQSIVAEIGDRSGKTTTITQDLDGVISKVEEVIDITDEVEDTDVLTLTNAMKGSLLELHIFGNNQVFDYIYPRNDLYPADDLYSFGDSRIRVWTDNICPDGVDNWINGYTSGVDGVEAHGSPYNDAMILSKYIEVDDNFYVSLENSDYKIFGVTNYDEDKTFISKIIIKNNERAVTIPNNTKFIRFEIVNENFHYNDQDYENNYPEIIPAEILSIKPMIMYGDTKGEYRGYNNAIIELGVTEVLRRLVKEDGTVLRDSFDLVNNKASITRRIGVDSHGDLYDLVTPVITDLGEIIIPIAEGENYFDIVNYNATCRARWVIRNTYTSVFASTVELESSITQLANSINLQVSKKVGNNEIIARINMAVLGLDDVEVPEDVEKSVIEILANKIQITSDYFDLSKNGYITATGGTVGGITLSSNMLYKRYTQGGANYESGLYLPSSVGSTGNQAFLYAGRPVGENLAKANVFIQHGGNMYFRSGTLSMIYEPTINQDGSASWRNAMTFSDYAINRYLPNGNRWTYDGITYVDDVPYGHRLSMYDAKMYTIHDGVHNITLAGFQRIGNNSEPSRVDFYGPSYVDGAVIQTASSDERLKENIELSDTNALEIIDDIDFYSFDWKDKTKGHTDIGFIAQRLQKTYDKLVIYSEGPDNKGEIKDTYQIDLLNTLALTMKGVQELKDKVDGQQEEINRLKEELNKLKGEENV